MLTDLLTATLGELLADILGTDIRRFREERAMQRAIATAVQRAETRFPAEYPAQDAALIEALTAQPGFLAQPAVKAALHELLRFPFRDPTQPHAVVQHAFHDLLPQETDRARVDAAVTAFLRMLGQEVLAQPELQSLYTMEFQRVTATHSRATADHTAALQQEMHAWRESIEALLPAIGSPSLTDAPPPATSQREQPWHNLPRRTYNRFVGRQEEMQKLAKLMLPYPRSRHFAVTLDGIGGVGKSALALEFAHRHRETYATLPAEERFVALVWVTAKRTLLTAGGIQQRQQTFSTLADLYREIANVLDMPAIHQADYIQQRDLVEQALSSHRTLLIVDNLETVDDEELLTFLRELPDPTKVIVTTRHRIDIAYAVRVLGMPRADALALLATEAASKNVDLPLEATDDLFRRTGGIPLAMVWSIGLMSMGHDVEGVLRRLGSGHSDIARFCFNESVAHIRERDAYRLLLALALFDDSVNRGMLGEVAGLGEDEIGRDDGLADLLHLSLVNKEGDRFSLLPLTRTFALHELKQHPTLEAELRERWVDVLVELAKPYADLVWRQADRRLLHAEGTHLVSLASWANQVQQPDVLLSIIAATLLYYDAKGHWGDMHALAHIALEYAKLTGDLKSFLLIATHTMAWTRSHQGQHDEAEQYVIEAFDAAKSLGNITWQCEVLIHYSQILRRAGKIERAIEYCDEALHLVATFSEPQQFYVRAEIDYELGKIARDRGDWKSAKEYFIAAREVFRIDEEEPSFNLEFALGIHSSLGFVYHQLGDLQAAAEIYMQCLDFFKQYGGKGFLATLLIRIATLEAQRGNYAEALPYARDALEWSERLGLVQERAQARELLDRLAG